MPSVCHPHALLTFTFRPQVRSHCSMSSPTICRASSRLRRSRRGVPRADFDLHKRDGLCLTLRGWLGPATQSALASRFNFSPPIPTESGEFGRLLPGRSLIPHVCTWHRCGAGDTSIAVQTISLPPLPRASRSPSQPYRGGTCQSSKPTSHAGFADPALLLHTSQRWAVADTRIR